MTVNAVERGVAIVESLVGAHDGLELGTIAARLGLPKSAVHRTLNTLMERGWVTQETASQNYVLSLRFAMLALRDLGARVITDSVQQVLDELAHRTREYCRIAVVEGETLTWVACAQGAITGLRYDASMGDEVTLYATATGKAWLATLPEDDAIRIALDGGLGRAQPPGPNTVATPEAVRRALNETRAQGFATANEEAEPGINAIAVSFKGSPHPEAPVAGTVSVAGPAARMQGARMSEVIAALREASVALENIWWLRKQSKQSDAIAPMGIPLAQRAIVQ